MREKHAAQGDIPERWDPYQTRVALAAARHHAARFTRHRRLAAADREDLAQDILLMILEAGPRFDASRASWATFVAMLARRAVCDRARQPAAPECVSLDSSAAAAILDRLVAPQADPDIALAFRRIEAELPTAPRAMLQQIIAHRDVVAARDAGATSPATFYRDLHDLRCWLRALGVHPTTSVSMRAPTPTPSAP
jgi:DNA-directed RNA polymerase specialized sigma24 family protein